MKSEIRQLLSLLNAEDLFIIKQDQDNLILEWATDSTVYIVVEDEYDIFLELQGDEYEYDSLGTAICDLISYLCGANSDLDETFSPDYLPIRYFWIT